MFYQCPCPLGVEFVRAIDPLQALQAPQGAEDEIGGASSELRQPAERKKIRGRRRRGEPQHLRINPSFTDDVQLTRTPTLRLRLRKRFAALMRDSTNGWSSLRPAASIHISQPERIYFLCCRCKKVGKECLRTSKNRCSGASLYAMPPQWRGLSVGGEAPKTQLR
jgi:hypothetical protein